MALSKIGDNENVIQHVQENLQDAATLLVTSNFNGNHFLVQANYSICFLSKYIVHFHLKIKVIVYD